MNKPILVFDMDGVLVEVSESYRETIQQTVKHFTGNPITRELIQEYKNRGGWNDDWRLSHRLIQDAGVQVEFQEVVDYFQALFHGTNGKDGLILRERWSPRPGVLEDLARDFRFAVFTGRLKWEAELTLNRNTKLTFDPIIGMEEVENLKPAPDGLLKILETNCDCQVWYIGDTVDDARCARSASVPFIGVAAKENTRRGELIDLFHLHEARAVIGDINSLPQVLAA